MPKFEQKTIEQYFQEFNIADEQVKEKILPQITTLLYDRNRHVVEYEAEQDEYRRKQLETSVTELEEKIVKAIKENQ